MKWLTGRGAAAALAVGVATVWGMGWRGVALLFAFFISSSVLSTKPTRNERQVLANGGVAAVAALAGWWPAFAGSLAAATADTWATEIGRRSPTPPRLISNGQPVPAGTDGGITLLGTLGGVAGAGLIAGLVVAMGPPPPPRAGGPLLAHPNWLAVSVAVAGVVAMLFDSLLGATVQGAFKWIDNDAVNVAATLGGAAAASAISVLCC